MPSHVSIRKQRTVTGCYVGSEAQVLVLGKNRHTEAP
jgi:hypothetical protein